MLVNRKSIEISIFISLEMALNIHEKEFTIPKTLPVRKKGKNKEVCVSIRWSVARAFPPEGS